jgi:hypothetical protein
MKEISVILNVSSEDRGVTLQDIALAARRLADELDRDITFLGDNVPHTEIRLPGALLQVHVVDESPRPGQPGSTEVITEAELADGADIARQYLEAFQREDEATKE